MDQFISTVKSQTFPIHGFDELTSSIYIPGYYWFENSSRGTSSWAAFMPPEILRCSFYRALQDFPLLAGRFRNDRNSRGYVDVDGNNLNMPVYTDSDWNTVDFKHLKGSGFDTHLLPENFTDACGIPSASIFGTASAKLGIFHVRRCKDYGGVLVFASIAHAVVDGFGYFAFMNRWAEASRWMHKPCLDELPKRTISHDRAIHDDYISQETDALDRPTLEAAATGNAMTRFLSWLPIDKRNIFYKPVTSPGNIACCSFHIPTRASQALREAVQEYAPRGTRLSTNDVLTALLTMVVGQAIHKNSSVQEDTFISKLCCAVFGNSNPSDTLAAVAVNMRPRVKHPGAKHFVGNLSFVRSVVCPQALVQAETNYRNVSTIATNIKDAVSAMDMRSIAQLNHSVSSEYDAHVRVVAYNARYKNRVLVSCISKYNIYELDFGAGTPSLIRPTFRAFPNMVYLMPCHPDIGGQDVVMALERDVAKLVVQDKSWMQLVESHNFDV